MNQQELQQKIAEFYAKLPPKAQEIFYGMGWLETLRGISTRYGLNETQIQTIGTETMLVLLGLIHIEEYESILEKEIALPKDKMEVMMQEINTLILSPIRPELTEVFNTNNTEESKDGSANLIQQSLDPRFFSLSPNIQKIISDSNYQTKIYEVSKRNNLTVAQIAKLEEIITDTLLGNIHPEEFESSIRSSLNLETEKIKIITEEINEQILKDIRNKILTAHHNETKSDTASLEDDSFEIFKSVGIDLETPNSNPIKDEKENKVQTKVVLNALELPSREDLKEINAPEPKPEVKPAPNTNSILNQKLGGSFKLDSKITEHSLGNVTKQNNQNTNISSDQLPKVDPYRMPIE